MPLFDGSHEAAAKILIDAVRDYVARSLVPIQAKIDALPPPPDIVEFCHLIGEEVAKAQAALPIPKDGDPGKPGEPGKDADPQTVAALLRPWITEEVSNVAGAIPKPKDGEPGRDAAHLEIMPAIDEAKSYPRGTYAKHANGFWRAFEATQGMRGWECLVAGIAEVEVSCAHEREFTVSHVLSDGTRYCQAFALPVLIYRGVYVEGREYHRGDQVSWGAHQWHCNEDTTDKPIEGGKAWTLAVKRGRDGKEGPAGPAGKDRIVREKA